MSAVPPLRIVHPQGEYVATKDNPYFFVEVSRPPAVQQLEEALAQGGPAGQVPQPLLEHILAGYSPLLLDQCLQHLIRRNVGTGARELLTRCPEVEFMFHPMLPRTGEAANEVPAWFAEEVASLRSRPRPRSRATSRGPDPDAETSRDVGYMDLRGVRLGGWFTGWDGKPRRAWKSRLKGSQDTFQRALPYAIRAFESGSALLVIRSLSLPYNTHFGDLGFCLQTRTPFPLAAPAEPEGSKAEEGKEEGKEGGKEGGEGGGGGVLLLSSGVFKVLHHPPRSSDGKYQHVDVGEYTGAPRNAWNFPDPSLHVIPCPGETLAREALQGWIRCSVLDDGLCPGALSVAPLPVLFRHAFRTFADLDAAVRQFSLSLAPGRAGDVGGVIDLRSEGEKMPVGDPFRPDVPGQDVPPPPALPKPGPSASLSEKREAAAKSRWKSDRGKGGDRRRRRDASASPSPPPPPPVVADPPVPEARPAPMPAPESRGGGFGFRSFAGFGGFGDPGDIPSGVPSAAFSGALSGPAFSGLLSGSGALPSGMVALGASLPSGTSSLRLGRPRATTGPVVGVPTRTGIGGGRPLLPQSMPSVAAPSLHGAGAGAVSPPGSSTSGGFSGTGWAGLGLGPEMSGASTSGPLFASWSRPVHMSAAFGAGDMFPGDSGLSAGMPSNHRPGSASAAAGAVAAASHANPFGSDHHAAASLMSLGNSGSGSGVHSGNARGATTSSRLAAAAAPAAAGGGIRLSGRKRGRETTTGSAVTSQSPPTDSTPLPSSPSLFLRPDASPSPHKIPRPRTDSEL